MASSFLMNCILLAAPLVSAVDLDKRIVRRESHAVIELGSMEDTVDRDDTPNATVRANHAEAMRVANQFDAANTDEWPKYEFPKGKAGTNDCAESNHTRMHHMGMCKYAAAIAHARISQPVLEPDFEIVGDDVQSSRPKGCFAQQCATGTKMCYFWNEYDGTPSNIPAAATPICIRPFYVNGVAIANDAGNGCPGGYEPIMDEDACRADGELMGYAPGSRFRTGEVEHCKHDEFAHPSFDLCSKTEKEKHRHYPIGCYINDGGDKVYFNFVESGPGYYPPDGGDNGDDMRGTPLCKVKTTTSWS